MLPMHQDPPDCTFERRQVTGGSEPDGLEVDPKVVVDELASHPGNVLPGNPGMVLAERWRKVANCLADNLDLVDHRALDHLLSEERFVVNTLEESRDPANCVEDVVEVERLVGPIH